MSNTRNIDSPKTVNLKTGGIVVLLAMTVAMIVSINVRPFAASTQEEKLAECLLPDLYIPECISCNNAQEIIPNLFVSNGYLPACRVKELGITHGIGLGFYFHNYKALTEYDYYPDFYDGSSRFINMTKPILEKLDHLLSKGTRVILHCEMGLSRSPSVAAAYLMTRKNMSASNALEFVKEKRGCMESRFINQLHAWELEI